MAAPSRCTWPSAAPTSSSISFRNRAPAEETAHEIEKLGRKAIVVKADIGEPEGIEQLFAETERAFGALDILVCNAASGYNRPVMEQRVKGWDWTMNINARSALFCAQKAVPLMQKRGRGYIVNQSSPSAASACCRITSSWARARPRWKP